MNITQETRITITIILYNKHTTRSSSLTTLTTTTLAIVIRMSIQTQQPCCALSTIKQYEKLVADANLQLETSNDKINSLNNESIKLKQQIKQLQQQIHNIKLEHKID